MTAWILFFIRASMYSSAILILLDSSFSLGQLDFQVYELLSCCFVRLFLDFLSQFVRNWHRVRLAKVIAFKTIKIGYHLLPSDNYSLRIFSTIFGLSSRNWNRRLPIMCKPLINNFLILLNPYPWYGTFSMLNVPRYSLVIFACNACGFCHFQS